MALCNNKANNNTRVGSNTSAGVQAHRQQCKQLTLRETLVLCHALREISKPTTDIIDVQSMQQPEGSISISSPTV